MCQVGETDVRHWHGKEGEEGDDGGSGDGGDGEQPPAAGRGAWRFLQVSAGFNHTAAVIEVVQ